MTDAANKVERIADVDLRGVNAVAERVIRSYGHSDSATLTLFPLTENWTYRVDDPERPATVLRVYRPGGRPLVEILSELAWMTAIGEEAGVSVPKVHRTLSGALLVEAPDASTNLRCYCVAFELAPGREPPEDELPEWFSVLGEMTARLHRQARAWNPPAWFQRPRWDIDTMLGDHPHWGPWHSSVDVTAERRQLEQLAAVVERRLERFGAGHSRFGLVHADLRLANILVDRNALTLIDFDDCGFSWYLYDLACALSFNEGRSDLDTLIGAWVDAYRRVETMPADDEYEIKTFIMLRRLMLSAYAGLRFDTQLAHDMREAGFTAETCRLAEPYLQRYT